MNREKKLISNFIVFLTGSFGSKLLQFLLIPLYTSILSPQEYGTVDVLQTVSMLLIPMFSLTIAESVFRYGMENMYDKKEVFSIGLSITGIGSAMLIALGVILNFFLKNSDLIFLTILLSIFNMLRTVTSQFLRASGKVKLFTIDNVLQTCGILGLNLLFLLVFRWGSRGYLLGYVGGNCISFLFGIAACGLWRYVSFSAMKQSTYQDMLKFSIPLIPNTICWWISSSTDRLMLTAMVGAAANGLYSVAHKIPSIISIIVNVFIQAWQISANEEFEERDSGEFYGKIFSTLSFFSFMGASSLMLLSKVGIRILTDDRYYNAWKSTMILIVGIAFFSFAQFLGTIYTANKKTEMAFITNLIATVINVIGNYVLIPIYGAEGAAVATAFSYIVFWLVRLWDTRKIINIKYHSDVLILSSGILVIQLVIQIKENSNWILYSCLCWLGILLLNRESLKGIVKNIWGRKYYGSNKNS